MSNKDKKKLFDAIRQRGLLWSYDPGLQYSPQIDDLLCEAVLKYGDLDELRALFSLYEQDYLFKIWKRELKHDQRFKRLNLFLARMFFGMPVEADYFEGQVSEREQKLRLLVP